MTELLSPAYCYKLKKNNNSRLKTIHKLFCLNMVQTLCLKANPNCYQHLFHYK